MTTPCRLYKSEYDHIPCDNWPCVGHNKKKFLLGDSSQSIPKMVLCEDCVIDLVNNVPPELLPEPEKSEPGNYYCKQCDETFDSPQKLGAHKRMHSQKRSG